MSERKRLEDENTTLKERMELALLGYNAGVYEWNMVDNSVYISPQWKQMMGYRDDELPNLFSTWADRVHPDDYEDIMSDVQITVNAKKEHTGRIHRLKHRNGQWLSILGRGIIQYDKHGKALRMVGIHTNVTEQKALQLKYSHQAQIIDQIHDSVISTDLDGYINSWNTGSELLLGYKADEISGKHIRSLYLEEDYELLQKNIDKLMQRGTYMAEIRLLKKSKKVIFAELSLSLLKDEKGEPIGIIGSSRDITEQKKAEDKIKHLNDHLQQEVDAQLWQIREKDILLIKQSRMAQMGEMISMIAHQWRQPLSAISSTSASIELKASLNKLDNDTAQQKAHDISNFAQHLSRTIDDFRNFFKPTKKKVETSYDELVASVLEIIGISIKNSNIELIQELNCHDKFSTYSNELKQVVLNLIKNAEDALLEKKTENPYIKIFTYKENDKYILEVSDNAGGIPEEIMENIFDPYFSTKTKKEGTGLGLYMSKTIVEEHCAGKLSVMNTVDGALFRIVIVKEDMMRV
ncbi:hypothetical protein YH65_01765 [Sulfurovum lithotrophicum]|uniref:histidine kinase n=1 Tax=Sulfurovum lithotrophicum TaxID=206403 RepID=A0A7U4M2Y9_9BACT|nr:hypothetical protein YH65_01765 [Sulfurovum lithotrophicum]